MNRIEERFQRLKQKGQKGFVVYIGAGDPNLDATYDLALAFDEIGVDVLELGVPFSDPLADGLSTSWLLNEAWMQELLRLMCLKR